MRRLLDFILNMEAARWRTLAAGVLLLGAMAGLLLAGKAMLGLDAEHRMEAWLQGYSGGPMAFVATVALFVAAAFVGAPQFILIAACVVAFGPWFGFLYSWIATVVSAGVTYWLGRGPTARLLARHGGKTVGRLTRFVGKNAFYASFMIRNVPSAPFIVVNMAAGVTPMRMRDFAFGTAIGIVPKIVLTAFAGNSIVQVLKGEGGAHLLWLALIIAAWIAIGWFARRWLKTREDAISGPLKDDD